MKGKGKTHRWRVLSGATPNYDFVQQGVSIKEPSFPGGLAPITVSRQDSLPKPPPKQVPKQILVWKPPKENRSETDAQAGAPASSSSGRRRVAWPKDLAGESTAVIDVDAQAEVVTGGAVAASTTPSSSASSSSSSSSSGGTATTTTTATPAPAASAAPPLLFTPEQTKLLTEMNTSLVTQMTTAFTDLKTALLTEMNSQVKGLEKKIADVAAEKKIKITAV